MSHQICTFLVNNQWFGVAVTDVQEVMREQPMTKVPKAPPSVTGLIHLRGQIVTAVDLRTRFGMPKRDSADEQLNILVRDSDGVVSLVIDKIGDVLEVTDDQFERVPDTLTPVIKETVTGVYKLDDRLLLMIDVPRVLDVRGANQSNARS